MTKTVQNRRYCGPTNGPWQNKNIWKIKIKFRRLHKNKYGHGWSASCVKSNFTTCCILEFLGFDYYYGTKLKYVAITINTTIFGPTLGYMDGLPVRDKWEQFVTDKVNDVFWLIWHTCEWAYAIMIRPSLSSSSSSVVSSLLLVSVYSCPSDSIDHRNFISCRYMHIYVMYAMQGNNVPTWQQYASNDIGLSTMKIVHMCTNQR